MTSSAQNSTPEPDLVEVRLKIFAASQFCGCINRKRRFPCNLSNNLQLYILGSEQKYVRFSSIGEFQGKQYQRDVQNNKYQIYTLPDYDEKHFRTISELESDFGVI